MWNAISVRTTLFGLTKMIKIELSTNISSVFLDVICLYIASSLHTVVILVDFFSFGLFFFLGIFILYFLLFRHSCSAYWTDPELAGVRYGLKLVVPLHQSLLPDHKAMQS